MNSPSPTRNGRRGTGTDVPVWSRQQFLDYFGREFRPGQHITLIGPIQRGKTRLAQEMLGMVISPDLPVVVLAAKPPGRDHTMDEIPERLGLTVTEEWPPPVKTRARKWWQKKVADTPRDNGYVLKPKHNLEDSEATEANMKGHFRRALTSTYAGKYGQIIVLADETKVLYDLKLQRQHEDILTRGAPVVTIISLMQRGRYVSYYAYDMPEWVLFFWDPDLSNVRRYAEMVGGVDPALIRDTMDSLERRIAENGMTNSETILYRRSGTQVIIIKMD